MSVVVVVVLLLRLPCLPRFAAERHGLLAACAACMPWLPSLARPGLQVGWQTHRVHYKGITAAETSARLLPCISQTAVKSLITLHRLMRESEPGFLDELVRYR